MSNKLLSSRYAHAGGILRRHIRDGTIYLRVRAPAFLRAMSRLELVASISWFQLMA